MDNDYYDRLFDSLKNHQYDLFKELINKNEKVNVNYQDENFNYLIEYAILFNQSSLVALLINKGARLDVLTKDGKTLLYQVIKLNYQEILLLLLKFNDITIGVPLIELMDENGKYSIHYCVEFNNINALDEILKIDGLINQIDNEGNNLLFLAIKNKKIKMIKYLLEKGIDINYQNEEGSSALHIALNYNNNEIVKILIDKGIDINLREKDDNTSAIFFAINQNNKEAINLLIKSDLLIQDYLGNTPIHYLIMNQLNDFYDKIKWDEIDFELYNLENNTILHQLLINYNINIDKIIEIGLKKTDVNLQNNNGDTILHLLVRNKIWNKFIEILQFKRMKALLKNNKNERVIDMDEKIIDLLIKAFNNNLKMDNNYEEEWEKICNLVLNKKNYDKKRLEDISKKIGIKNDLCEGLIEYQVKNKIRTTPIIKEENIVINNGIAMDNCHYLGLTLDILVGLIYLKNKHENLMISVNENFIKNEKVYLYYQETSNDDNYKIEFLNFEILYLYQNLFYPTELDKMLNEFIKDKKYKLFAIPIGIQIENGSHANIIIIDKDLKTIERFEPNGKMPPYKFNYNYQKLDEKLKNYFLKFLKDYLYQKPNDYLPQIGFQMIEMSQNEKCDYIGDPNGFCAVWCLWYLNQRIINNNIPIGLFVMNLKKKLLMERIIFRDLIRNYANIIVKYRDQLLIKSNLNINKWINFKYSEKDLINLIKNIKNEL